jgi:hypothetical protein
MPLLDHFHPPLRGPRRWEGFHHAWAANIAQQLNQDVLPTGYFAESEISLGPNLEIDVAAWEATPAQAAVQTTATAAAVWAPSRPALAFAVDFAHLDVCEVRVYEELGGAELRAAIELVSPANKDRPSHRRTFTAKCAGYLRHGVSVVIVDVVTERSADLHAELVEALDAAVPEAAWQSPTGLYAVAYRPVPARDRPRVEAWPEALVLGRPLPVLPLWLTVDACVPLRLEESYVTTCTGLRIPT